MFDFLKAPESKPFGDCDYWHEYRTNWKKDRPISYWLNDIYWHKKIWWRTRDLYWNIYRRIKEPAHIVKNGLNPNNYYDYNTIYLHTCFAIFTSHMENELNRFDDGIDGYKEWAEDIKADAPWQYESMIEKLELYEWWTEGRLEFAKTEPVHSKKHDEELPLFRLTNKFKEEYPEDYEEWQAWCKAHGEWETAQADKETEMLVKLAKINQSLWS